MQEESQDRRYAQADREALLALGVYALYFVWWYGCAYGLGGGDPADYSYVLGLPAWFFYSCVVGYGLIVLLLWGMVRFFYQEMPLEADLTGEIPEEQRRAAGPVDASTRRAEEERP